MDGYNGPNEVSQKEFAELRGVSPPMVSRWKKNGRLVMTEDGRQVCVRESFELLERTLDPARGGDRTGKARPRRRFAPPIAEGQAQQVAAQAQAAPRGGGSDRADYHDAATDEKRERAAILRLERLELEGKLVFRDQVEREAQSRAAQARDALASMVDRIAPLVAMESDLEKVRALLDAEVRFVSAQLSAPAGVIVEEAADGPA